MPLVSEDGDVHNLTCWDESSQIDCLDRPRSRNTFQEKMRVNKLIMEVNDSFMRSDDVDLLPTELLTVLSKRKCSDQCFLDA